MTTRTVLRGARHPGDVAFEDGRIVAVGEVAAEPGDRVVDCSGTIVTPGLINTHHHLYQWLTRGRASGCDLFSWLKELYPVWARITPDDVGAAAARGMAELALSGVSTVFDHHYVVPHGDDSVFDSIAEARGRVGVRLVLSRGSMDLGESDGGLPPDDVVERTDDILSSTEAVHSRLHDGQWTSIVVAPCSPFSVTPQLMSSSAELARSLGVRLHTHLAETVEEVTDCLSRFQKRPLDFVEELGWLGPDVWYAHGIHFEESEVVRIGAAGAGVCHCPSSNARLGAGSSPVRELLDAGASVGLGVDGPASNEVGELFGEMRQALYLSRLRGGPAGGLSEEEALALATSGGAKLLGRDDIGQLAEGKAADVAVFDASDIADIADPVTGLVLGPTRKVRDLYVAGEEVVRHGELVACDLDELRRESSQRAQQLWA